MKMRKAILRAEGVRTNLLLFLACSAVFLLLVSPPVRAYHPYIQLLEKDGELIDPVTGENAEAPFSTEQTCGLCHDYDVITQGYHFQTGWNVVSDTFGVAVGKPWVLSDGMLGKWCVQSLRQLAKKVNKSPDEIDLTPFDFIGRASYTPGSPTCGSCHSGGGGLEYDRDGERYDERLTENPNLRESLDGDYYQSEWDKSGVVEADCFICHWPDYNFEGRVEQLKKLNYKWAVVEGSGLGIVTGSVEDGEEPEVRYNQRFFNSDGTLVFNPSWPPQDENCMFCHGLADVRKRGFSWNDIRNPDVHQAQGMSCTHCHPAGEDHQLAKGDVRQSTVADNLDNTMKGCEGCHFTAYLGATVPVHRSVRPGHLDRIACQTCHIPKLGRSSISGVDATRGELHYIPNPLSADGFGEAATWRPVYEWGRGKKIYPYNLVLTVWYGNLDSDGIIYPLFAREQAAAWELYSESVTDDNGDGVPEINRKEEIVAGLKAVAESLEGNRRFSRIRPVLIKGGKAYQLDEAGSLKILDREVKCDIPYSLSHNVAELALGSGGCSNCHDPKAQLFEGTRLVDLYGEDGRPVTTITGRALGGNPVVLLLNSFHQEILRPIVSLVVVLVIFFVVIHYHSYGPKRIAFVPATGEIERFSLMERAVHLFRLIAFGLLAITGVIMAFNWVEWQVLLFRSPKQMLWIHIVSGLVFFVTTVMGLQLWFKDALFTAYDRDWVRKLGGYLGYKGEVPAGRFNAGQKMFYWYSGTFGLLIGVTGVMLIFKHSLSLDVVFIVSTLHNLFAFALIAGVLAHGYLGTIANPGTWRVLVDGRVTEEWAKHHHPNWYWKIVSESEGDLEDDESG